MFCSKCGKQNDDNAMFCNGCGNSLNGSPTGQPAGGVPVGGTGNGGKKKTSLLVKIVIGVIVFLVFYFVSEGIFKAITDKGQNDQPTMSNAEAAASSSEYNRIFSDRNIVHIGAFFPGMESAAYAKEGDNGTVEAMEIGYKNDVIQSVEQTLYIDVTATTQERLDQLGTYFTPYNAMDNVTVTVTPGYNYYTIRIRMDHLDDTTTLRAVIDANLLSVQNSADVLSASETQTALLGNGYAKK